MIRKNRKTDDIRLCGECKDFGRCRRENGVEPRDRACWEFLPWYGRLT